MVESFVVCVFEPGDIVEVRLLPSRQSRHLRASELAANVTVYTSGNEKGDNIFVGPNPRKEPGGKTDRDVALTRCLFADFDNVDKDEVARRIHDAGLPEPTLLVASGHGVHAYWRLLEPLEDMTDWRGLQKGLAKVLESDPHICNPSRIMRLPGFTNHGDLTRGKVPAPCLLLEAHANRRYSVDELRTVIPVGVINDQDRSEELPCGQSASPDVVERARRYLEKIPGAVTGDHGDTHTYRVACKLVRDFAVSPDQALELLTVWNQRCEPPWTVEELATKIRNARSYGKNALGSKVQGADMQTQQDSGRGSADLLTGDLPYNDLAFQIDTLPRVLQSFVREAAKSVSCRTDYVAAPLLVALGTAIGRSRRLQIKKDWMEYANLWIGIVGGSGTGKSPAAKKALDFVQKPDRTNWVADTTVEALADVLDHNPHGVILARDELSALFKSCGQYKQGKGADEEFYLSAWSGSPIRVDRVGRTQGPLIVPEPFLAIFGGIQPRVLARMLTADRIENGFAARWLFVYPHPVPRQFTPDTISASAENEVQQLFDKLDSLAQKPGTVEFSTAGAEAWRTWIEGHQQEGFQLRDNEALCAAWTKMESYMARLILVLHMVRQVSGECDEQVDPATVKMAEKLIAYFKAHANRVYAEALWVRPARPSAMPQVSGRQSAPLESPPVAPIDPRAVTWITKKGNPGVRPRDLVSAKVAKGAVEAKDILARLVQEGVGVWSKAGRQRAERFYLKSSVSGQQNSNKEAA